MRNIFVSLCAFVALSASPLAPAAAQTWPQQTIKIVVPFPPGGAADLLSRSVGQKISESLGQTVIVENRAGVAGSVGTSALTHARPDGYTIGMGSLSTMALNPAMSKAPLYDPRKDIAPVAMLTELPLLMGTPPSLGGKDVAGLAAWAKANPGKMNYSSNGVGSSGHILGEMLKRKFGFEAAHAPYGGDVPIVNALIGEQIQLGLLAIPAAAEFVKAGKIGAAATTGPRRSPILPDVPTLTEQGYPDLTSTTWFCIVAPAGTPGDIVALLNREINKALATPDILQVFKGAGLEPSRMELAEFEAFVQKEQDKWSAEIRKLAIQID